jgi:hypothetical protein
VIVAGRSFCKGGFGTADETSLGGTPSAAFVVLDTCSSGAGVTTGCASEADGIESEDCAGELSAGNAEDAAMLGLVFTGTNPIKRRRK